MRFVYWIGEHGPAWVAAIGTVIALFRIHSLHIQLNSRMDDWLKAAKDLAFQKGVKSETDKKETE